ncbi:MAG: hypothetical protein H0V61_09585 [Chitinophagales bacterium]|nr:hypothetical protein [Chitinophagales bacterium]
MNKKINRRVGKIFLISLAMLIVLFCGAYVLAQLYKKEILANINEDINERIHGTFLIKDLNYTIFNRFPSISLTLTDAFVRDTLYPFHKEELFRAGKIFLEIDVMKLLRGEINLKTITIQNATISMLILKNGYLSYDILRKKRKEETDSSSMITTINKIILHDVKFSMVDSSMNKWFKFQFINATAKLKGNLPVIDATIKGKVHFDGLEFNHEKGSYLTDNNVDINMSVGYNENTKALIIFPSNLKVYNNNVYLKGDITFHENPHMHLELYTRAIKMAEVRTIVTQSIAAKLADFSFESPFMAAIFIDGLIAPGTKPEVDLYFKSDENTVDMKTRSFTDINMLGMFTNHIDRLKRNDDHNSRIVLPHFNAKLAGIPLHARMIITDLLEPALFMDAKVNMTLKDANELVDSSLLTFGGGSIAVSFEYNGRLVNYIDTINQKLLAKINGKLSVYNGEVTYIPRDFHFTNVNTNFYFNDTMLTVENLSGEINKNPVEISGTVQRFVPFLFLPNYNLVAALNVSAPSLNLDYFKSSKGGAATGEKSASEKKAAQKNITRVVNQIIDNTAAEISLTAGVVKSQRFKATDVKGIVSLSGDFVRFNNVNMKTSGGIFSLNGGITSLQRAPYHINITASISNADVSSLFYSFDNFQQKAVTHEDVKGVLSTSVNFSAQLKKDYSIDPSTMKGNIQINLKKGALLNFTSLDEISKFIFKDRDFNNIEFAQIKGNLSVQGQQLELSRMEIQSSVLTLFVQGVYGFKSGTDISIQIPLSNLKKRDTDFKPENIGTDVNLGPSIFLRAVDGANGKMQIKYDPFKNYYKEKALAVPKTRKLGKKQVIKDNIAKKRSESVADSATVKPEIQPADTIAKKSRKSAPE